MIGRYFTTGHYLPALLYGSVLTRSARAVGVNLHGDADADWRNMTGAVYFQRLTRSPPALLDHPTPASIQSQQEEAAAPGRLGHARRLGLPNLTAVGTAPIHHALNRGEWRLTIG